MNRMKHRYERDTVTRGRFSKTEAVENGLESGRLAKVIKTRVDSEPDGFVTLACAGRFEPFEALFEVAEAQTNNRMLEGRDVAFL